MSKIRTERVMVSTLFGKESRQPLVRIEVPTAVMQISTGEARALAMNILRAAEAADADGALVAFSEQHHFPEEAIAALLQTFRKVRDRSNAAEQASTDDADYPDPFEDA